MTKLLVQHSPTCFQHTEDNYILFSKDMAGNIIHRDSPGRSNDWGSWASINGDLDTIEWYFDSLLHRWTDNPAVMCGGNEEYYWYGKRHRLNAPARIKRPKTILSSKLELIHYPSKLQFINLYSNGEEPYFDEEYEYWQDDKLHRLDGPAKHANFYTDKEWWYKGIKIDCRSQKQFEEWLKYHAFHN